MNEILRDNVPFARQYIGARYVPKFYEGSHGAEWEQNAQYEPLTIVTYLANSYCSKKFVPAMTDNPTIAPEYWVCISNFNGQVEILQESIDDVVEEIGTLANLTTEEKRDIVRAINELVTRDTQIENKIGDLTELETTNKHDLVNAINEAYNSGGSADTKIGNLNNLTTETKNNVVGAINEVDSNLDNLSTNVNTKIGNLNNLTTEAKDNLINAINEVDEHSDTLTTIIGLLSNLTTDAKNNLVSAINELNRNIGDLNDLDTSIKTSIVDAINNITSIIPVSEIDYITPTMFGGVGDDTTDDTQAIIDCFEEARDTGKTVYIEGGKIYKVTSSIVLNYRVDYNIIMDGSIHYTGTGDAIAINDAWYKTFKFNVIGDYDTEENGAGIKLNGATNCCVTFDKIIGFKTGILLASSSNATCIGYNTFILNGIGKCKTGLHINCSSTGWCNENLFIGGRFASMYITEPTAICIESSGSWSPNQNIFIKPCVEGQYEGIRVKNGVLNSFYDVRFEGCTTSYHFDANTANNYVRIGYGGGVGIDDGRNIVTNHNNEQNRYTIFKTENPDKYTFKSGFACSLPPYLFYMGNNAPVSGYIPSGAKGKGYIGSVSNEIWCEFNVENYEGDFLDFKFDTNDYTTQGAIFFQMKDGSDNIITAVPLNSYGAYYRAQTDGGNSAFVGTNVMGTLTSIQIPVGCKKLAVCYLHNTRYYGFTVLAKSYKGTLVPIKHFESGLPSSPTDDTNCFAGNYVKNVNFTTNPDIKGWIYNGAQWVADYIYNPNA